MKKLKLEDLKRMTEAEFKSSEKNPLVFVLDNVRSLHNVGSVFRTADAFRAEKIYLCGITGRPPHREIEKTALGATESVAWEHGENAAGIVQKLLKEGYEIWCIEQTEDSTMLHEFHADKQKKYAFVFGNEVFGVQEEVLELVKQSLEIPQYGTKHSLNVSVAAGIVAWHFIYSINR